jgi:tetratricopeptide (TPR) repeat protein
VICIVLQPVVFSQSRIDSLVQKIKQEQADSNTLHTLNDECIAFLDFNQHTQALKYIKVAIRFARKKEYTGGLAISYNVAGNCYFFKGDYSQAIGYYLKALTLHERLHNQKGIANCFNNIGNAYTRQGYYSKALSFHNKALKIRKKINDEPNLAFSYNNIGNVYQSIKNYKKALEHHFWSLEIKEKLKDSSEMVISLNNIGGVYTDMKNYDQAIVYHQKALELNRLTDNNKEDEEVAYINMARAFYYDGQNKEALDYAQRALSIAEEIGDSQTILEGSDLLGKIYEQLGDYEKALVYFHQHETLKDRLFNEENTAKILSLQYDYEYDKKLQAQRYAQMKKDAVATSEKKKQNQILWLISSIMVLFVALSVIIFRGYLRKQKINKKITIQNDVIREKQREIIDSINYAKRIQNAVYPDPEKFVLEFDQAFVFNRPKDIVSGDLYWFANVTTSGDNPVTLKVIVLADCTGHGVPGAFLSLLAIELLNQSVKNPAINSPGELLNFINFKITNELNKKNKEKINDGMDIAVCAIDEAHQKIYYSGANRPLWIMRKDGLEEIKPTKTSIGSAISESVDFETVTVNYFKNERIFLFSDGITDQFGGEKNKKFTKARLKLLLEEASSGTMVEIENRLQNTLLAWMGNEEQTDDVLVVGIQL